MNKDIFQGKIKEISGELRKKWGALTDDDIQKTKGNLEALSGLVQQKIGLTKEEASRQVNDFMSGLDRKFASGTERAGDKVNQKIDNLKDKLSH
ncbi:CsbD family protein [Bdellovibrio bacteriovorus]|uniref:CsbD family protein n=1 Tax=Bdellovibrio bacteriovorus TaxID=959 RepID=UPI0021D05DB6|nr:CsbD family protein [Bdellovibrio bacteriovorus]UXR64321.1 CsbD family protein [Bdellovibrio bacteriovorus]